MAMSLCLNSSLVLRGYTRMLMRLKVRVIDQGDTVLVFAN